MANTKPILQYGSLAGWPYWLAEGLNGIGQPSINVIPEESDVADLDRRLPHHEAVADKSAPRPQKLIKRAAFLQSVPRRFSLVHYHGGQILRGSKHHLLEGPYLAARGVPMLVSFGGGDARILELARKRNPYFYRDADPARDEKTRKYLRSISKYIRFAATDCEMVEYIAPYFEHVFTFRQPIDFSRFPNPEIVPGRPPVVLHVPTEPHVKGTEQFVAAVETLKAEGLQFEFKLVRQLTQKDFYRELASCDIYADELRCGSYGVTAVEAMACGKPTISYIRPDLVPSYPAEMPIANANPDNVIDVLRELIVNSARRAEIATRSLEYARRYHEAQVVAAEMLDIYRQIGLKSAAP